MKATQERVELLRALGCMYSDAARAELHAMADELEAKLPKPLKPPRYLFSKPFAAGSCQLLVEFDRRLTFTDVEDIRAVLGEKFP